MESFRKFDVYDEVDIDDLTPEERSKIIGRRWVLTPKSDTVVKARYVAQGYAQYVEPGAVCATTLSPTTIMPHISITTTVSHADVGCFDSILARDT